MSKPISNLIESANEIFDLMSNNHEGIQNEYFKKRGATKTAVSDFK